MSALRAFFYVGEMTGSLDQFVLIKAGKSRGGVWSDDDYYVRDRVHKVVGRIMLHPQAPKDKPWFWTIVAREIPPSVHNRGYSESREQAMADFKAVVGEHQLRFMFIQNSKDRPKAVFLMSFRPHTRQPVGIDDTDSRRIHNKPDDRGNRRTDSADNRPP